MLPVGTTLGDLRLDRVFIEFDGPQLFSCVNQDGQYFFAVHAPSSEGLDNWLYVRVSPMRLAAIVGGIVALHDAFASPEGGEVQVVSFSSAGGSEAIKVTSVNPSDLDSDWLPDPGEFLEDAPLYASNYPVTEAYKLPSVLTNPQPMWELDPAILAFLKSRRTPVEVVANRAFRSVFDLVLNAFDHSTNLAASTLGKILISAQNMVDGLTPSYPARTKLTGLRSESRLDALAFFPSSFGVRLVTNVVPLITHPGLEVALDRFMALLSASTEAGTLHQLLHEFGPKAALRYKSFAKALAQADTDLLVELGVPGRSAASVATMSRKQVGLLVEFLDREVATATETFTFRGSLVGFSLRTKFFRLEGDDQDISGRIADEFLSSLVGKTVGGEYAADITSITEFNEATGEEHVRYVLTGLNEVRRTT
jgi:hypothetical protein